MIFIVEYIRREGKIVSFQRFQDSQRNEAEDARLKIELELNRKHLDHEVALLDAESEEMLRKTHRRYFESLRQLLENKQAQTQPDS